MQWVTLSFCTTWERNYKKRKNINLSFCDFLEGARDFQKLAINCLSHNARHMCLFARSPDWMARIYWLCNCPRDDQTSFLGLFSQLSPSGCKIKNSNSSMTHFSSLKLQWSKKLWSAKTSINSKLFPQKTRSFIAKQINQRKKIFSRSSNNNFSFHLYINTDIESFQRK